MLLKFAKVENQKVISIHWFYWFLGMHTIHCIGDLANFIYKNMVFKLTSEHSSPSCLQNLSLAILPHPSLSHNLDPRNILRPLQSSSFICPLVHHIHEVWANFTEPFLRYRHQLGWHPHYCKIWKYQLILSSQCTCSSKTHLSYKLDI